MRESSDVCVLYRSNSIRFIYIKVHTVMIKTKEFDPGSD